MLVLADVRVFEGQFISYYFVFYLFGYYCNKYDGLLVKTKTVMLLLFVLLWQASEILHELPFFNVPYIPAFIFTILILFCYSICGNLSVIEYLSFAFEWNRYSLMGRLISVKYP